MYRALKRFNLDLRLITLIFSLVVVVSCSEQEKIEQAKPTNMLDMTLAAEMSLLPATVWVAEEKGYFTEEGLNLTIKEFDSGRNALEAMLKDSSIDMATVAQTPVVFNSFKQESYSIIATMAYSVDDVKILARKDHGIVTVKDLKGKKIGVTLRSTGHYFLEGFLSYNDMSLKDIDLQDVNASKLKGLLISGELDAITSWEPHIYNTKKVLGEEQLSLFLSKVPFRKDFYFTVGNIYATEHSENIYRFLRAVVRAEQFIKGNRIAAQQIVSTRLGVDKIIVENIWDAFTFSISLDQSILVSLEDEAEWAIEIKAVEGDAPNYLDYLNLELLDFVKPDAVTIIHGEHKHQHE